MSSPGAEYSSNDDEDTEHAYEEADENPTGSPQETRFLFFGCCTFLRYIWGKVAINIFFIPLSTNGSEQEGKLDKHRNG